MFGYPVYVSDLVSGVNLLLVLPAGWAPAAAAVD
jgi:hypothetical protein